MIERFRSEQFTPLAPTSNENRGFVLRAFTLKTMIIKTTLTPKVARASGHLTFDICKG